MEERRPEKVMADANEAFLDGIPFSYWASALLPPMAIVEANDYPGHSTDWQPYISWEPRDGDNEDERARRALIDKTADDLGGQNFPGDAISLGEDSFGNRLIVRPGGPATLEWWEATSGRIRSATIQGPGNSSARGSRKALSRFFGWGTIAGLCTVALLALLTTIDLPFIVACVGSVLYFVVTGIRGLPAYWRGDPEAITIEGDQILLPPRCWPMAVVVLVCGALASPSLLVGDAGEPSSLKAFGVLAALLWGGTVVLWASVLLFSRPRFCIPPRFRSDKGLLFED